MVDAVKKVQTQGGGSASRPAVSVPQAKTASKPVSQRSSSGLLAAVRIRCAVDSTFETRHALDLLHMSRKNTCAVVKDTPSMRGMLRRVDAYTTWGEVSPSVVDKLKPRLIGENVFGLHPPRGGFERKGIKVPFKVGGARGYRGAAMDALLERMS